RGAGRGRRAPDPRGRRRRRRGARPHHRGRGSGHLGAGGRGGLVSAPDGVERDYPLSRLTTVRTGGPADFFARVSSPGRLEKLLAWASREGLQVGVVGSGSNLLVADLGFRGLVLKLDDELARID